MGVGCVAEVDMFMAFRQELSAERSVTVLRHVAGCPLCHDLWKRFELDEQVADGIQCALRGDSKGADRGPGWAMGDELPERLDIPGFKLRPGYIEGGQARVYRGTYEASQEEVAVKVFHNSPLNEGESGRFAREIKSLARLRHPNVITIRSDGEIKGHAYYVMPWIEGWTLDEYIKETPLTFAEKVGLVIKICDAVSHAHRRGVMHLDLKPTNVRVDAAGEPIVMDFGLARLMGADYSEPPGKPVVVAGTPLYMAPEQIDNRDDLDVRADVYGLGLLIYEVLVGRRAKGTHLAPSEKPTLDVVREEPPSPRTVNPKVPSELDAITMRAIQTDRDRRYQTALALHEDLESYKHGRLVQAKAHQRWYRLHKWMHLYREALAMLGLIVLIIGFAVAIRMNFDARTLLHKEIVDKQLRETNEVRLVREQELVFALNRTRRELIEVLKDVEYLASMAGDWDHADESCRKQKENQAKIEGTGPITSGPTSDTD
ncbi:MAG: serine/threonine protein kinase [Phycisphaerae bacterium]|nr:serine/threonine protein kinase [Phycisphaerae bacterium]